MSDFLSRLAERQLVGSVGLQPSLAARLSRPAVPGPSERGPSAVEVGGPEVEATDGANLAIARATTRALRTTVREVRPLAATEDRARTDDRAHEDSQRASRPARRASHDPDARVWSRDRVIAAERPEAEAEPAQPLTGATPETPRPPRAALAFVALVPSDGSPQQAQGLRPAASPLDSIAAAMAERAAGADPRPAIGRRGTDPPVVHVSIGRVEVRAITAPAPVRERPAAPSPPAAISLDEYLERRHGAPR